jgi:hypothetical protein
MRAGDRRVVREKNSFTQLVTWEIVEEAPVICSGWMTACVSLTVRSGADILRVFAREIGEVE